MSCCAGISDRAADQWLQGCKWAAITIVVVSAPVLGKVTQVPPGSRTMHLHEH